MKKAARFAFHAPPKLSTKFFLPRKTKKGKHLLFLDDFEIFIIRVVFLLRCRSFRLASCRLGGGSARISLPPPDCKTKFIFVLTINLIFHNSFAYLIERAFQVTSSRAPAFRMIESCVSNKQEKVWAPRERHA